MKFISKLFNLLTIVLCAVGLASMALPFYQIDVTILNKTESYGYNGFKLALGGKVEIGSLGSVDLELNEGLLAAFILCLVALLISVALLIKMNKTIYQLLSMVSFLALVASGILCFCTVQLLEGGFAGDIIIGSVKDGLGTGAYISGISFIAGGFLSFLGILIAPKSKKRKR